MWPMLLLGALKAGTEIYSGYKKKQAADQNAELLRQQAEAQKNQAYDRASRLAAQGEAFKGSQRSAFASSGVKLDSGSPLAVLRETQKNLQQDISRTKQIGDNAYSLGIGQANQLQQQGQDAFTSSILGGAASFLGDAYNSGAFKGLGKTTTPDISTPETNNINNADFYAPYTGPSTSSYPDYNKVMQQTNPYGNYDWKKHSLFGADIWQK